MTAAAPKMTKVFRAALQGVCYYCKKDIWPTDLVARINDGALRHWKCAKEELGQ